MSSAVLWFYMVRTAERRNVIIEYTEISIIKVILCETFPFFVFSHVTALSSLSWRWALCCYFTSWCVSKLGRPECYAVAWRHVFVEIYWRFRVVCCLTSQWIRLKTAVTTRHHIAKDGILYRQRHENLRYDVYIARTMPTSWIKQTLPLHDFQYRSSVGKRTQAHGKWGMSWGRRSNFCNWDSPWSLWGMSGGQRNSFYNWGSLCSLWSMIWGKRNSLQNWDRLWSLWGVIWGQRNSLQNWNRLWSLWGVIWDQRNSLQNWDTVIFVGCDLRPKKQFAELRQTVIFVWCDLRPKKQFSELRQTVIFVGYDLRPKKQFL